MSTEVTSPKGLKQFSTICMLVVMLTGCQMIPDNPSGTASLTTPDPAITEATPSPAEVQVAVGLPEPDSESLVDSALDPLAETELAYADLWQRIRDQFVLDHHLHEKRVQDEFDWLTRHPDYLDRVATRASRYLYHIVEEIERRGLPMEFALLPIVESAFDPFAYSHGRASGLWQFIPGTGKRYGLKIDYWYDGRRDVPEATRAALDYLEALHKSLNGDWLLALAAYNSGEGNVRHSLRKNINAGKPVDFFSLSLLPETSAYVPRLLAVSALIADPEAYTVKLKSIPDEPYWVSVDIGSQIDLAKAAELAQITTEELYLLNPAYNKWSTHPDGPHRLLVPVAKARGFADALEVLPEQDRLSWTRHQIKSGETLGTIAARYSTSIGSIQTANRLRGSVIRAGDSLLIPVATSDAGAYHLSDSERLKTTQARLEQQLGTERSRYTVKSGDNLWDLSRRFGVSVRSLAKWNGMAPTDMLMPGKELVLFTRELAGEPLQLASAPQHKEVIRKVNYQVRRGESLSLIASKFNLSVAKIKTWNQGITKRKYLQPGDRITLYVDVTRTDD